MKTLYSHKTRDIIILNISLSFVSASGDDNTCMQLVNYKP